jgi:hypothetical protein
MDIKRFSAGVFLKFNIKVGIEDYDNMACLRSSTIENMIHLKQPLLVTASNKKECMVLFPQDVKSLIISDTPFGGEYTIMRFEWKPQSDTVLEIICNYYDLMDVIKQEDNGTEN